MSRRKRTRREDNKLPRPTSSPSTNSQRRYVASRSPTTFQTISKMQCFPVKGKYHWRQSLGVLGVIVVVVTLYRCTSQLPPLMARRKYWFWTPCSDSFLQPFLESSLLLITHHQTIEFQADVKSKPWHCAGRTCRPPTRRCDTSVPAYCPFLQP